MERVMLTLPPELLHAVDALSHRKGRKRSQLVRQALEEMLERERQREYEELMAEGYREMAEDLAEFAADFQQAQAEAAEGLWTWDD